MKKNFYDFNPFFLKIIILNEKIDFIIKNYKIIKLANSLSYEDIFLMFIFLLKNKNIKSFILNTNRLFSNNIKLLNKISKKYFYNIIQNKPNEKLLNKYIKKYTLNGLYNNIILRKICCYIRKVIPLYLSIKNNDIWITGQRKLQSIYRKNIFENEYNKNYNLVKSNLLFNWNFQEIFFFLEKFNILTNYIYNFGYFSIGCEPCTKSIKIKDEIRSGRWWWETKSNTECGIHN